MKTTKKGPSKAAQKKAVKELDVKPAKGGSVRGGWTDYFINLNPVKQSPNR